MAFKYVRKMPEVKDIIEAMPLRQDLKKIKTDRDKEISDIFKQKSGKFLLIIGPCSADNEAAIVDYAARLAKIKDKVKDKLVLVPRVYTNKPRTTGKGYKGMAHQPDPTEKPNMTEGIRAIRKLHLTILEQTGFTNADEMLYPSNYPYLEDLLSYVAIGARSVENQQHRLTVSGLDIPTGMKNPMSGDLTVMMNSVLASQIPHVFTYNGWEVETQGNELSHAILRGAVDSYGRCIPNYHYEDVNRLKEMYDEAELANPGVVIDANHANSDKNYKEQTRIAMEIMGNRKRSTNITDFVKGLMIESYLVEGRQDIPGKTYGQSITDACIGWEETETLIQRIADFV
ncbi:MAG: 3-deoxy-7-phosphoheptulonate synthase [Candidatus Omnitrophica bacterium]|nr:3-deoxy-7-phosphoheptulonate synthase [Candidatus Omnitrophota bacterium]